MTYEHELLRDYLIVETYGLLPLLYYNIIMSQTFN